MTRYAGHLVDYDACFWWRYRMWHVSTDHPWDLTLHLEAMQLAVDGAALAIGEALVPAIRRATEAIERFAAALEALS